MKNSLIIAILFMSIQNGYSQNYFFKDDILKDSTINSLQKISELLKSGYYIEALEIENKYAAKNKGIPSIDSSDFYINYSSVNAFSFILEKGKQTNIIIINEDHNRPQHRVFAEILLTKLFQIGYSHIAIEALGHKDVQINDRLYPLQSSGSIYMEESNYANMLRTALKLGYKSIAYEDSSADRGFDITKRLEVTQVVLKSNERDSIQALNIYNHLKANKGMKIIIYCGFDHLLEIPSKFKFDTAIVQYRMAYYLTKLTGINPLTINQTIMTETSNIKYNNPYFNLRPVQYPTVFINKSGESFIDPDNYGKFDIEVFHPVTNYINGRPIWLFENTNREKYILNKEDFSNSFPCLLMAFLENDADPGAIPVDIVEITSIEKAGSVPLALIPGIYNIFIKNKRGDIKIIKKNIKESKISHE